MPTAIIGGGAAGFFAAIQLKETAPRADVTIYEAAPRVLAKVSVTGGGRCNLTNSFADITHAGIAYPRGERLMKGALKHFSHKDTYRWFEDNGVPLVTQSDHCVFPQSQQSSDIIDLLLSKCHQLGVNIRTNHKVSSISKSDDEDTFRISFEGNIQSVFPRVVIVATGGSPRLSGLDFLSSLPLNFIEPVPSLFSFNLGGDSVTKLMGTVVENVTTSLPGTKMKAHGPLLITHWGMSGPSILKLSSYAARWLAERDYKSTLAVNWLGDVMANDAVENILSIIASQGQKQLSTIRPYDLPSRLWLYLIAKSELPETKRWAELGRKGVNKLASLLTHDEYTITGKNRFKDEFVTCGGVSLDCIDRSTMECRSCPALYFAGEVTDVDAITGGFNLQAAWTMGYIAACSVSKKYYNVLSKR